MPRSKCRIAVKSIFKRPDWTVRLHKSVVGSIWKYGSVAFVGMDEYLWEKLRKCHLFCMKLYLGVPNYVNYETVCDHIGIDNIRDALTKFA